MSNDCPKNRSPCLEKGFVYLWALFAVVLAGVAMAGAGQMWQVKSQREKEAELMFIGEEFRKAIMSYYNANSKQYPASLEDLLKDSRSVNIKRHLRKIYIDPMTNTSEWGIVEEPPPNTAAAKSSASSAQNKNSTTGSSSTSTGNQATNPNQTANSGQATNPSQTGNPNQSANTGQTSTTNPSQPTGSTADNKSTSTSSSGMSSGIGTKIIGVYSLSEKKPIKKDQFPEHYAKFKEALTYKDWHFVFKPDSKTPGTGGAAGASSAKPGAASSTPGGANSPFSSQSSSSSRGGSPASPASSPGASPFGSPSQPATPRGGGSSPFSPSSSNDD